MYPTIKAIRLFGWVGLFLIALSAPAQTLTSVSTDALCNGTSTGAIDLTVTGGSTPYTYFWNTTATTEDLFSQPAGVYTVTVTDGSGSTATLTDTINEPAPVVVTAVTDSNVSCNGLSDGGVTASATGGTPPYVYSWSGGGSTASITGLAPATYGVVVNDNNGCQGIAQAIVTEPAALLPILNATNVFCNGDSTGTAIANIFGGTQPYTYLWSNGAMTSTATGLVAGTYTLTVTDANGCTDQDDVTVTQPNPLAAGVLVQSNVSCNGGNNGAVACLTSGGFGQYFYSWSNGGNSFNLTGLTAGTYCVTLSDSYGCTTVACGTVSQPAGANLSMVVDSNVTCPGGTDGGLSAVVSGGSGNYTYAWSNAGNTASITGLSGGTYTVTVTEPNGCTTVDFATVTEPPALSPNLTIDSNVACFGGFTGGMSCMAVGGSGGYTYLWSTGATGNTALALPFGLYCVTVVDSNGCVATDCGTIIQPTQITTNVTIDQQVGCIGESNGEITVAASGGTGALTYLWSTSDTTATITGLSAGTYTVTVTDSNGCEAIDSAVLAASTSTPPVVNLGGSDTICPGDTITLLAGSGPYTYNWTTGDSLSSLQVSNPGTYGVTVSDNTGCSSSDSFALGNFFGVTVIASSQDANCDTEPNGQATTVATGTPPLTYLWSDAQTTSTAANLLPGTYTVTVTDGDQCTNSATVMIGFGQTGLQISLDSLDTICEPYSYTILVDAGSSWTNYQWSNGATTQGQAIVNAPGTYSVTATDSNGCASTDSIILVGDPCTSVPGLADGQSIRWFPNPTDDELNLEVAGFSGNDLDIAIFDSWGRPVQSVRVGQVSDRYRHRFDLSALARGVYLVRVVSGERVFVERVVLR